MLAKINEENVPRCIYGMEKSSVFRRCIMHRPANYSGNNKRSLLTKMALQEIVSAG